MTAGSWIRCNGCGDEVHDDLLRPEELRDALQQERGWVWTEVDGRVLDVCPREDCADDVAVQAGHR